MFASSYGKGFRVPEPVVYFQLRGCAFRLVVEAEGETRGVLDDLVDAVAVGDDGAGVSACVSGFELRSAWIVVVTMVAIVDLDL